MSRPNVVRELSHRPTLFFSTYTLSMSSLYPQPFSLFLPPCVLLSHCIQFYLSLHTKGINNSNNTWNTGYTVPEPYATLYHIVISGIASFYHDAQDFVSAPVILGPRGRTGGAVKRKVSFNSCANARQRDVGDTVARAWNVRLRIYATFILAMYATFILTRVCSIAA